jgi:hypothetical protein
MISAVFIFGFNLYFLELYIKNKGDTTYHRTFDRENDAFWVTIITMATGKYNIHVLI